MRKKGKEHIKISSNEERWGDDQTIETVCTEKTKGKTEGHRGKEMDENKGRIQIKRSTEKMTTILMKLQLQRCGRKETRKRKKWQMILKLS